MPKRLRFEKRRQKEFLMNAMATLYLSQRAFSKKLGVSRRAMRSWLYENHLLPENIFEKCVEAVPSLMSFSSYIISTMPENWGRVRGGKIRSEMKSNLTAEERIKGFRHAVLNTFKKKTIGPKGELMYNEGERLIAQTLLNNGIEYEYEPLVSFADGYAFPDFKIENNIIERCGYSGYWNKYWARVLEKILFYKKHFKGKIILIVPDKKFQAASKLVLARVGKVIIIKESEIDVLPCYTRACKSLKLQDAQHG